MRTLPTLLGALVLLGGFIAFVRSEPPPLPPPACCHSAAMRSASAGAAMVSGHTLLIDGGWTAAGKVP